MAKSHVSETVADFSPGFKQEISEEITADYLAGAADLAKFMIEKIEEGTCLERVQLFCQEVINEAA